MRIQRNGLTGVAARGFGVLTLLAASSFAALVDTFDPPNPNVTVQQSGLVPGPTVIGGGPTGSFLRLVNDGVNNQRNQYVYHLSDPGAYSDIAGAWSFRGFSGDNPADGYSMALIPNAAYPSPGGGPNLGEGAGLDDALGIGVFRYNLNQVRVYWDNAEIRRLDVPEATANFRDGSWNQFSVGVQQRGEGSNVVVDVAGSGGTATPISQYVYGVLPYENRVQFSGRTGGSNMDVDLDNVSVVYASPYVAPAAAPGGTLYQDFDSLNTTPLLTRQDGATPGPLALAGGPDGNFLRLVNNGVGGQSNRMSFDRAFDGGVSNSVKLDFDFRGSTGSAADGFSAVFLPTGTYGDSGIVGGYTAEEPNVGGALAIGFDPYFNANPPDNGANDVSVHYDGNLIANVTAPFDLTSGVFHHAEITAQHVPGGANVSVTVTPDVFGAPGAPVTILNNVFVAGWKPYDYRVEFSGRTGGVNMDVDLDNILSGTAPPVTGTINTVQDFDGGFSGGTQYKAFRVGAGSRPDLVAGSTGDAMRLLFSQNSESNQIAFDRSAPGLYQRIEAEWDFAIGSGADGLGLALENTAYSGTTGIGLNPDWEEPNLPESIGFGLDIYNNIHDASVHWDNAQRLQSNAVDFRNAGMVHASAVIDYVPGGANVSLSLDTGGGAVALFTDQFVSGMIPYESRVVAGGRTGGLNTTADVDNIDVRYTSPVVISGDPFHWLSVVGNYPDPTKWSTGVAPTANDDAFIEVGISNSNGLTLAGAGSLSVSGLGQLNNAGTLRVGYQGANGELNQSGGSVNSSVDLWIADADGSPGTTGTYTMTGGTLSVGGAHTVVGRGGVGHFIQSGNSNVTVNRLFIAEFGGSSGSSYTLNGGTLTANGAGAGAYALEVARTEDASFTMTGGVLNVNNGDRLLIGRDAEGVFTQSGGTVNASARVHLGGSVSGVGRLNLSNGDINIGDYFVIGDQGQGFVDQSGGTISANNRVILGDQVGSAGSYDLSGGTLNANGGLAIADKLGTTGMFELSGTGVISLGGGDQIWVGAGGNGHFIQTGGTVNAGGRVHLGDDSGAVGLYELSGGQLNQTGNPLVIGVNGTGTFSQTGGAVNQTGGNVYLADNVGAEGHYSIGPGASLTTSGELRVGNRDVGTFTMTGGTVSTGGALRLAPLEVGDGTFDQSGGTVTVGGRLELTDTTTGTSTYTMSGGVLNVSGDYFIVGRQGPGHFVQSGDSEVNVDVANRLLVADGAGSDGSTYTISGGVLNVDNGKQVSIGKSGTGTFTQNGGTVNATGEILLGEGTNTGTYNLQGGVLNVDTLSKGSPNGAFNFTGGTLHVQTINFDLQQDGGHLAPGNSPGTTSIVGDYDLLGGALDIELNGYDQGADPGYDFVDVTGDAFLDAGVLVNLLDGWFPAEYTTFDVLQASSVTLGPGFYLDQGLIGREVFEAFVVSFGQDGAVLRLRVAVPEPASASLLVLGLMGLAVAARRRR